MEQRVDEVREQAGGDEAAGDQVEGHGRFPSEPVATVGQADESGERGNDEDEEDEVEHGASLDWMSDRSRVVDAGVKDRDGVFGGRVKAT